MLSPESDNLPVLAVTISRAAAAEQGFRNWQRPPVDIALHAFSSVVSDPFEGRSSDASTNLRHLLLSVPPHSAFSTLVMRTFEISCAICSCHHDQHERLPSQKQQASQLPWARLAARACRLPVSWKAHMAGCNAILPKMAPLAVDILPVRGPGLCHPPFFRLSPGNLATKKEKKNPNVPAPSFRCFFPKKHCMVHLQ